MNLDVAMGDVQGRFVDRFKETPCASDVVG